MFAMPNLTAYICIYNTDISAFTSMLEDFLQFGLLVLVQVLFRTQVVSLAGRRPLLVPTTRASVSGNLSQGDSFAVTTPDGETFSG